MLPLELSGEALHDDHVTVVYGRNGERGLRRHGRKGAACEGEAEHEEKTVKTPGHSQPLLSKLLVESHTGICGSHSRLLRSLPCSTAVDTLSLRLVWRRCLGSHASHEALGTGKHSILFSSPLSGEPHTVGIIQRRSVAGLYGSRALRARSCSFYFENTSFRSSYRMPPENSVAMSPRTELLSDSSQ